MTRCGKLLFAAYLVVIHSLSIRNPFKWFRLKSSIQVPVPSKIRKAYQVSYSLNAATLNANNGEDDYNNGLDVYGDPIDTLDEEVLQKMRLERIINNDRWQSCLMRDEHGGKWTGRH